METTNEDRLLTPKETSELLAVPRITLIEWRRDRLGPPYVRLGRRTVRYWLSDLRAFLAAGRVEPLGQAPGPQQRAERVGTYPGRNTQGYASLLDRILLQDGKVTPRELRNLREETWEARGELAKLLACFEAEAPKAPRR
jgi:predicted DNA-binding transcriptional regulator AlpA